MFALEKPHLKHVPSILSFESNHGNSISRTVHKDNIIKYKSNRYSVPLGTYKPGKETKVRVRLEGNNLVIESLTGDKLIASHTLCHDKGQLIKNKDHQRNRSKTVDQLKHKVIQAFVNSEAINVYIDELYKKYPRYMRDQLQVMIDVIHSWPNAIDEALHTCLDKSIFSANDFRDITQYNPDLKFPLIYQMLTSM